MYIARQDENQLTYLLVNFPCKFAKFSWIVSITFCALCISNNQLVAAWTDEALIEVRDGFSSRRDSYLTEYLQRPFAELDSSIDPVRSLRELQQAQWVWYPEQNSPSQPPSGLRYFRRQLTLPTQNPIKKAYMVLAVDNTCTVSINGKLVGRANGFQHAKLIDITQHLIPGDNVVTIAARNLGDEPNPAGVLGLLHIDFEQGAPQVIVTNEQWQTSDRVEEGWNSPTEDSSAWPKAEELGACDSAPWGEVKIIRDVQINQFVFSRLTFALAALHLETESERANAAILEAIQVLRQEEQATGEFGLHWLGGVFYRIYGLFGPGGPMEGRLSDDAAHAIEQLFADWAFTESKISESDPEDTWRLWGSENHSAQRDATRWAAARMLAASPLGETYRYQDGSTAQEQLVGWRKYLKRYYRERVKRGMLIEISPSGYGSRTLQGWHNIYDFTDDPELESLVKAGLDVWWANWAQEQLGGMRGGGKTRLYPGAWALAHHDRNRAMSWFYLGQGNRAHHHETLPVIATTTYRLPLVVMDIALDPQGRGVYECKSRRLGRHLDYQKSLLLSRPNEPIYDVDPEQGGIVRYSYCTPDFIMGSLLFGSHPKEYWTAISQQNRWHGIIFAGEPNSTLYPRCETDRSTYNAHWAIQHKGTLIAQKLRHADATKAMRVCFSTDLKRHERDGWIFAQAKRAFAAVKVVRGTWDWDDARWLRCSDEYTPVILEVARSEDFAGNFETFQQEILKQTVSIEDDVLHYRGLRNSGNFTFYLQSDQAPELNGAPINLAPDYAFQSPFVNEKWAEGVVYITKGKRKLIVDVRQATDKNGDTPSPPSGEAP